MNEKQFATLSTNKVFFRCAIPGILTLISSSIFIIINGIFVGKYIGTDALAAINLSFPIQMIAYAVGDMIAVGSSVKISIALGNSDLKYANKLFSSGLLMMFVINLMMSLMGFVFAEKVIFAIIDDVSLAQNTYDYAKVFLMLLPSSALLFAIDNYLRACGKVKFCMFVNISVSILNVLLNYILIVLLDLGIGAAAFASGISMSIGSFICLIPFLRKKLTLRFTTPWISLKDMSAIIYNGSSEFFNKIAGSIVGIIINMILLKLGGSLSVAAYGIVMYIDGFLVCVIFGILDSIQPPVSYNVGKGNRYKVLDFFKLTCILASVFSVITCLVIGIFPGFLARIFTKDNNINMIKQTEIALLLFAPSYLFVWFNMVVGSFLTSLNKPKESLYLVMFRSIVLPILCLFILPQIFGVNGVFLTQVVANGLTFLISIVLWRKITKEFTKPLFKKSP